MNSSTQQATQQATAIKLARVPADYKLQTGETFIRKGRETTKGKPYFHTIASGLDASAANQLFPAITAAPQAASALRKLWSVATIELLNEKAAPLDSGATATIHLQPTDIIKWIEEAGSRERSAVSGDDIRAALDSYAGIALAQVYGWNAAQRERVSNALARYSAPAMRHSEQDAKTLLSRFEAFDSLLTGDDSELDEQLLTVSRFLLTKLRRDCQPAASLSDSI